MIFNVKWSLTKMSSVACCFPFVAIIGIAFEKVIVQRIADFQQHVAVYPRVLEDAVHVLARALQLCRQPSDGSPLSSEFLFDKTAYMWGFERGHGFEVDVQKNSVESIPCLTLGFPRPLF